MENAAQDAASKFATLWKGISTAKSSFLSNVSVLSPTNSEETTQLMTGENLTASLDATVHHPSHSANSLPRPGEPLPHSPSPSPDTTLRYGGGGLVVGGDGGSCNVPAGVKACDELSANYNQRPPSRVSANPSSSPSLAPNNFLSSGPGTMTRHGSRSGGLGTGNGALLTSSPGCHRSRVGSFYASSTISEDTSIEAAGTATNACRKSSNTSDWYKPEQLSQKQQINFSRQEVTNNNSSSNYNLQQNCSFPAAYSSVSGTNVTAVESSFPNCQNSSDTLQVKEARSNRGSVGSAASVNNKSPGDDKLSPKKASLPQRSASEQEQSSSLSSAVLNVHNKTGALASSFLTKASRLPSFRNLRADTVTSASDTINSYPNNPSDQQQSRSNAGAASASSTSSPDNLTIPLAGVGSACNSNTSITSVSPSASNSRLSNLTSNTLNSLSEETLPPATTFFPNNGNTLTSPSQPQSQGDNINDCSNSSSTLSQSLSASKARTAMMNAKYLAKLLKKQNSVPNGQLSPETATANSSNHSLSNTGTADTEDGKYAGNSIFCVRCKSEVVKQNGEWVEKFPRETGAQGSGTSSTSQNTQNESSNKIAGPGFFSSALSSVLSSVKEDRGGLPYVGSIHFSLSFDFQGQVLTVNVIEAKNLTAKDRGGTSDPYVKVLLLPEKKRRQETRIVYKNLNPVWNQSLTFTGVALDKLQKRILQLMVLDYDKFSRDDPIGEVNIPMCELDFTQPINQWKDLNPIAKEKYRRGEILISMSYNPVGGILTMTVVKCKDLKPMDISGTSDPYVKIYHLHQNRKVNKYKTQCRMQSLNPVFDETFTFTVATTKLDDTQLVVTVMDKDMIKWNEKIGSVVLGRRSGHKEMQHWQEMLKSRRTPVTMWHHLRADLD